ncbi:hypothetical protein RHGRI_017898 [Rhododendron griersonianum]|uniref:Uncharacterized protein n=1 Tax=Rhododendron griersonianum TaxID=479676 RepID=A0AAV6JZJ2_9ERIC|nr:hypothetical protein RHGRI_017898 [Rhododendron griersonianum]
MFQKIQVLVFEFSTVQVTFCYREFNRIAERMHQQLRVFLFYIALLPIFYY